VTATLCPQANVHADFLQLHQALQMRGFTSAGDTYALEVQDATGATATLLIAPFANGSTGETAGLSYGVRATGAADAMAIVGDDKGSPTYGLIVDQGQITEILPDQLSGASGVRALVVNAQVRRLSCKQCSNYCRFATILTGIVLGLAVAFLVVSTGGLAAGVAGALGSALISGGGLVASQFCPSFCNCSYCGCNETCYDSASACTAACSGFGLSCISNICRSPQPFEC
jgi:hypothetical protein